MLLWKTDHEGQIAPQVEDSDALQLEEEQRSRSLTKDWVIVISGTNSEVYVMMANHLKSSPETMSGTDTWIHSAEVVDMQTETESAGLADLQSHCPQAAANITWVACDGSEHECLEVSGGKLCVLNIIIQESTESKTS